MHTGPPLGSRRQDILREPWFLGTLLGCIGGLLWLGFCVVSIWLYRRRKAVAGRKLKTKNMAAYSGNNHCSLYTTLCDWSKSGHVTWRRQEWGGGCNAGAADRSSSAGSRGGAPGIGSEETNPPEAEAVCRHCFTDFDCRNDQNSKLWD